MGHFRRSHQKLCSLTGGALGRNLVDDVEVEGIPTPAGVRLLITISERPVLRSIDYGGVKRLPKTDLEDKMSSQRIRNAV